MKRFYCWLRRQIASQSKAHTPRRPSPLGLDSLERRDVPSAYVPTDDEYGYYTNDSLGNGPDTNFGSGSGSGDGDIGSGEGSDIGSDYGSGSASDEGSGTESDIGSGNDAGSGSGSGSDVDFGSGSETESGSGTGEGSGDDAEFGSGSGEGSGSDIGTGSEVDSGTGSGEGSGSGTGSETGEESGSGSGTGSGSGGDMGSGSGSYVSHSNQDDLMAELQKRRKVRTELEKDIAAFERGVNTIEAQLGAFQQSFRMTDAMVIAGRGTLNELDAKIAVETDAVKMQALIDERNLTQKLLDFDTRILVDIKTQIDKFRAFLDVSKVQIEDAKLLLSDVNAEIAELEKKLPM